MSFTKATLIEQALNNLGVLGAGQPVAAEDFDRVERLLKSTIALLSAQKVVSGRLFGSILRRQQRMLAFPNEPC